MIVPTKPDVKVVDLPDGNKKLSLILTEDVVVGPMLTFNKGFQISAHLTPKGARQLAELLLG